MENEQIFFELKNIVRPFIGIPVLNELDKSSNLKQDLSLESIDMIDIVAQIEDRMDIMVEDNDIENLETIDDIIKLIKTKNNA